MKNQNFRTKIKQMFSYEIQSLSHVYALFVDVEKGRRVESKQRKGR